MLRGKESVTNRSKYLTDLQGAIESLGSVRQDELTRNDNDRTGRYRG